MTKSTEIKSVVYTNKAKCRDCYRCVRVCPVNAIKMENGQAMVIPENCISCGTCIPECPQNAKTYVKNTDEVLDFLSERQQVIISVAPSFASVYNKWERKRLPSALRQAGFSLITETAIGAYEVALKTREIVENKPDSSHICTACPAVVNYIEKYSKKEIHFLTPVVSPMVAHARMLKKQYGAETKVVFVGPCVAKKSEALHPKHQNIVDAVVTFEELNEILKHKNEEVTVSIIRDGVPKQIKVKVPETGLLGIYPEGDMSKFFELKKIEYGFWESIPAGINKGVNTLSDYIKQFKLIFTPETKAYESLGGFITIGKIFPGVWDWQAFWTLTAFLSIILAFMNILPIPALDGGHVMFLLYEMVTGRKPGDKFLEYAQIVGLVLLFSLLLYANLNDVFRLFKD
ncbi:MAG: 4Fe-4S binding protein [Cyclobacteriaceae bacterium]|nr:4Fe-4S binding protein [Cyclobacteriaceae bacterium]